jgi:hypothetical protein
MLKIFRIILYIISGFFICNASILAFITLMPATMIIAYEIIGLLFLLAAMATNRFRKCKQPVGITLLSAVAVTALIVLNMICVRFSPTLLKIFPDLAEDFFSNYLTGGMITLVIFIIGLSLTIRKTPI